MKTTCPAALRVGVVLAGLACLVSLHSTTAWGASFTVNSRIDAHDATTGDGTCASSAGACTVRAAIEETNSLAGADTVTVPAGVYKLQLGELQVTDSLTLNGSGANNTVLDAGYDSRVLAVLSPGELTASGLRIQHGQHNECGGGIYNQAGATATLSNSAITRNRVRIDVLDFVSGGGLCNDGTATLTDVDVSRNQVNAVDQTGYGGGIENVGTLTLTNTRISHNRVNAKYGVTCGGGIDNVGAVNVDTVTMLRNRAFGSVAAGGGLCNLGQVAGSDLTVRRNVALGLGGGGGAADGGGILDYDTMTIAGVTVTGNRAAAPGGSAAGGGIELSGDTANLSDVVITHNRALGLDEVKGGGLANLGSHLTMTGGLVSLNLARGDAGPTGGGVWNDGEATFTNLAITFNRAAGPGAAGGGLFEETPVTLNNVVISDNVPQ